LGKYLPFGQPATTLKRKTFEGQTGVALAFKRILLKLSGEALAAKQGFGVDPERIHEVAA
jgi:hypothetical protein